MLFLTLVIFHRFTNDGKTPASLNEILLSLEEFSVRKNIRLQFILEHQPSNQMNEILCPLEELSVKKNIRL